MASIKITYRGQFRVREVRSRHSWWDDVPAHPTDQATIAAARKASASHGLRLLRLRKYADGVEVEDVYGPFD